MTAAQLRAKLAGKITVRPVCPACRMEKEPKQFADSLCFTCRWTTEWDGVERRSGERRQDSTKPA